MPHGEVVGVVPFKTEVVELALKFVGDGKDEGIVGGCLVIPGPEEVRVFLRWLFQPSRLNQRKLGAI